MTAQTILLYSRLYLPRFRHHAVYDKPVSLAQTSLSVYLWPGTLAGNPGTFL